MSVLRAIGLVVAFAAIVTPALAQDHSSEQSEAQISGRPFFFLCAGHYSLLKFCARRFSTRRPKPRMHALLLRAIGPVHLQLPADMAARHTARE